MDSLPKESYLMECDDFFSFYNILKIITDIQDFRCWLKEEQELENDESILSGYLFFVETCSRCFLDTILTENPFQLNEDYVLYRAKFVGVEIQNIPNTCEKIVLIKNIWNVFSEILKSSEWSEVTSSSSKLTDLFDIISTIYQKEVISAGEIEKDSALNLKSAINAHIYLNDLQRHLPLGYLANPLFETKLDKNHFEKNYMGYAYSLQYLWYRLLPNEDYEKAKLYNISNAHKIYSVDKDNQDFMFQSDRVNPFKNNWIALDRFFGIIHKEIIGPLEAKINSGSSFKSLLKINDIDKSYLNYFLRNNKLGNPAYLHKEDQASVFQKLDYYFYWYHIDVLDDEQYAVFNGIPAFTSILLGHAKKKEYYDSEKVCVVRIKHPACDTIGFDYSYAILIEAFSNTGLADYSGWLIFYSCATDYSGFGGSLHDQAEVFIEQLLEEKYIRLREIIIDKILFREYLESKKRPSNLDTAKYAESNYNTSKYIISDIRSQENNFLGDVKGKFFEYMFYNWLSERQKIKPILLISDIIRNKEQIDVYLETEKDVHVFECKVSIHRDKLNKVIKQIKKKKDCLAISNKCINVWIVVFEEISDESKKVFREQGINVCSNFKKKIEYWRKIDNTLNRDSRKIIKQIFEFETHI